jgi:polygalacturonase
MGIHIKTRSSYGGYVRNVVYEDNYFETAGAPGGFYPLGVI